MAIKSCDICDKIIINRNYYVLCKKCLLSSTLFTKNKIKKIFFLSDKELSNIKYVPFNNSKKYFLKDINNYILSTFGSYAKYNTHVSKKKYILLKRKKTTEKNKIQRKEELINALNENKLIFKNYGYCYSYINYGKPDLDTVIKKELEKEYKKTCRKLRLSGELSKLDIKLDESLESCYNYINNIGNNDLKNTVRAVEIEYFLKYKTEYLDLINIYDKDKAKHIAIKNYYKKNNKIFNEYK